MAQKSVTSEGKQSDAEDEESTLVNGGPLKRGRGRPKGSASKKIRLEESSEMGRTGQTSTLVVLVTPVQFSPENERPRHVPPAAEQEKEKMVTQTSRVGSPLPRKRGRPRKLHLEKQGPKQSQPVAEEENKTTNSPAKFTATSRKRGRPRKLSSESVGHRQAILATEEEEDTKESPPKGPVTPRKRGRPRKVHVNAISSERTPQTAEQEKENMTMRSATAEGPSPRKRGRPRKVPVQSKRGRPRKYPLTEEEMLRKTHSKGRRVWKPLGRPRIYPVAETQDLAVGPTRRGRGRPRKQLKGKLTVKAGAALNDHAAAIAPSDLQTPVSPPQRKRGRPLGSSKREAATPSLSPAKRNRGSVGKPERRGRGTLDEETTNQDAKEEDINIENGVPVEEDGQENASRAKEITNQHAVKEKDSEIGAPIDNEDDDEGISQQTEEDKKEMGEEDSERTDNEAGSRSEEKQAVHSSITDNKREGTEKEVGEEGQGDAEISPRKRGRRAAPPKKVAVKGSLKGPTEQKKLRTRQKPKNISSIL